MGEGGSRIPNLNFVRLLYGNSKNVGRVHLGSALFSPDDPDRFSKYVSPTFLLVALIVILASRSVSFHRVRLLIRIFRRPGTSDRRRRPTCAVRAFSIRSDFEQ